MKSIKIYCMAHKLFNEPADQIYVPLQVGAEINQSLGYVKDNEGDNISSRNPFYSELTGLYWMWKNGPACDITGLCHYRRFFLNEHGNMLTAGEIESILGGCDLITSGRAVYANGNIYDNYGEKHYSKDLDLTGEVIREIYPEYYSEYQKMLSGNETYFANMFITSKEKADAYAKWLFDILFEVEKRIDLTGYDDYNRRVFGFISERLLMVWIRVNSYKVCECPVGLTESKAETKDAIRKSSELLKVGNYKEVLQYLDLVEKNRPDAFYKDSDTEGELALIYTFAKIMELEACNGLSNLMESATDYNSAIDYKVLIRNYQELSEIIFHSPSKLWDYIQEKNLSIYYNLIILPKIVEETEMLINLYNLLANTYLDHGDINMARIYVTQALQLGENM
ncbi:MAG: DUF4422 domain-containing protein [Lachnospiraceae bacterium]